MLILVAASSAPTSEADPGNVSGHDFEGMSDSTAVGSTKFFPITFLRLEINRGAVPNDALSLTRAYMHH